VLSLFLIDYVLPLVETEM